MNHDADGGGSGWQHWALMALCCADGRPTNMDHRSVSFGAWSLLAVRKAARP